MSSDHHEPRRSSTHIKPAAPTYAQTGLPAQPHHLDTSASASGRGSALTGATARGDDEQSPDGQEKRLERQDADIELGRLDIPKDEDGRGSGSGSRPRTSSNNSKRDALERAEYARARGTLDARHWFLIHDLLRASLAPIGRGGRPSDYPRFLSAFTDDAKWWIALPREAGAKVSTKNYTLDEVFDKFWYPLVSFQWSVLSDLTVLLSGSPTIVLETSFQAFVNTIDPDANPLVAVGTIKDTIRVDGGVPLILYRSFSVEKAMRPEYINPTKRCRNAYTVGNKDAFQASKLPWFWHQFIFSILGIYFLRAFTKYATPLIAISALFGSVQNLGYNGPVGTALAWLGIVSSAFAIITSFTDIIVGYLEDMERRKLLRLLQQSDKSDK